MIMRHISMTPFGRQPVTAGLLATQALAEAPAPDAPIDKWVLLKDLSEARANFSLSDRNLAVLSALLTFLPARELRDDALTVFPSNASLSARLHGMPESTLRRHLAALVDAGMLLRHDSPNGKRYATRDGKGRIEQVFGFSLRPLLLRATEIATAAASARETARNIRKVRQTIALLWRDLSQLVACELGSAHPGLAERLAALQPLLRRKLGLEQLLLLSDTLRELLENIAPTASKPEEMSGNDIQNERHQQSSDSDNQESEYAMKQEKQLLPLELVLKAAPEILEYALCPVRTWRDLEALAEFVHPMMGITTETWRQASEILGRSATATVLACILQRLDRINSPGAYLRRLTNTPNFQTGPMVMALLRAEQIGQG